MICQPQSEKAFEKFFKKIEKKACKIENGVVI